MTPNVNFRPAIKYQLQRPGADEDNKKLSLKGFAVLA
jgi:hypothetical protein